MTNSKTPSVCDFLKARYRAPNQSIVGFRIYFWILIVVFGLVASLLSLFQNMQTNKPFDLKGITISLIGYSLVLLFSSAIEFIFIRYKDDEVQYQHLDGDIKMIGVGALILGILLGTFSFLLSNEVVSFILSLLLVIGGWLMWWMANSKSLSLIGNVATLQEMTGDDEKIGGSIPSDYQS